MEGESIDTFCSGGDLSMILVGDFRQLEPIDDWSMCDTEATYATCPKNLRHLWRHARYGKLLLTDFKDTQDFSDDWILLNSERLLIDLEENLWFGFEFVESNAQCLSSDDAIVAEVCSAKYFGYESLLSHWIHMDVVVFSNLFDRNKDLIFVKESGFRWF